MSSQLASHSTVDFSTHIPRAADHWVVPLREWGLSIPLSGFRRSDPEHRRHVKCQEGMQADSELSAQPHLLFLISKHSPLFSLSS